MKPLADIKNWEQAFEQYSVSEIRAFNAQLGDLADAKQHELRHLVGNRYKDMLKTADIIISMNEIITQEDSALSDLVTNELYTLWDSHERHFLSFSNAVTPSDTTLASSVERKQRFINGIPSLSSHKASRGEYLREQSIQKLIESTLSFVRRHLNHQDMYIVSEEQPHNFLLIARGLRLAELLLKESNSPKPTSVAFQSVSSEANKVSQFQAKFHELKSSFDTILTRLLLNGEANDIVSSASYNTLFLAYAHFKRLNPNQVLENLLESRLAFVDKKFDEFLEEGYSKSNSKLISFLPEILTLISATYAIAHKSFSKNVIPMAIIKQHSVYLLLDAPELCDDIELKLSKYRSWLPESIRNEKAFPDECKDGILSTSRVSSKTSQYLKAQLTKFSNGVVSILDNKIPRLIDLITDLEQLVTLYKQVLEVARDNASIRNLEGSISTQETTFYDEIFVKNWAKQFNSLIKTNINQLLNQENALRVIHDDILSSKELSISETDHSLSLVYDTLFSTDFSTTLSATRGYSYTTNLFNMLDDFSLGSVGSISPVAHLYKVWLSRISSIRDRVTEFGRLRSLLALSYGTENELGTTSIDLDEEDIDDNLADEWRSEEKTRIDEIYKLSNKHIQKTLDEVYNDMLKEIDSLFEKNDKSEANSNSKVDGAVLLVRAMLLFDSYFESMNNSSNKSESDPTVPAIMPLTYSKKDDGRSQELVTKIFISLAKLLADTLPKLEISYFRIADTGLWTSGARKAIEGPEASNSTLESKIWPDVPSLAILKYFTDLVEQLLGSLGHDNLLWTHDAGHVIVQQEIGANVLELLDSFYQTLRNEYQEEWTKNSSVQKEQKENKEESNTEESEESEESVESPEETTEETTEKTIPQSSEVQEESSETKSDSLSQYTCAILQLFADFQYVSQLLNLKPSESLSLSDLDVKPAGELDLDNELKDIFQKRSSDIKTSIKEYVTKTRIVYLPLAA